MTDQTGRDGVLLLHGLGTGAQGVTMRPLARRLTAAGFAPVCLDYPSSRMDIDGARRWLGPRIAEASARFDRCHLVGHSLGGVLAARLACEVEERRRGRIVQLGAPNLGSPLAALALRVPPAARVLGPALHDLARGPSPCATQGIGAIAGRTSWGPPARLPGGLGAPFTGASDGKVSVASALSGADDTLILPIGHAFLPLSRRVAEATVRYLQEGRFGPGSAAVVPSHGAEPKAHADIHA